MNLILVEKLLNSIFLTEGRVQDIHKQFYSDIPEEEFNKIIAADPTSIMEPDNSGVKKMGNYSKWLLTLYKNHKLKIEDLYKAKESLALFGKNLKSLPQENRDINRLKSLPDLFRLTQSFEGTQTKGEQKREVKSEGADKLYEDGQWIVIWLKTEEAAKYYAKGTKWCTGGEENNMFQEYHNEGNIYVNINKQTGAKYQFHFESNQFMDAQDDEINPQEILSKPVLEFYDKIAKSKDTRIVKLVLGDYESSKNLRITMKVKNDNSVESVKLDAMHIILGMISPSFPFERWFYKTFIPNLSFDSTSQITPAYGQELLKRCAEKQSPLTCLEPSVLYAMVNNEQERAQERRNYYSADVPYFFKQAIQKYYVDGSKAPLMIKRKMQMACSEMMGLERMYDPYNFVLVKDQTLWQKFKPLIEATDVWGNVKEDSETSIPYIIGKNTNPQIFYDVIKSVE